MQALAKATADTTNSTIELILTPRPRAGYAGIKSRVGFRMITSFAGMVSLPAFAGGQVRAFVPRQFGPEANQVERSVPTTNRIQGRLASCRAAPSCALNERDRQLRRLSF